MQRNFFPEIFFEFSLGHAVKPVTAHLTTFIIISMFIRVITKKIQIFTKEQKFTANPNQNYSGQHSQSLHCVLAEITGFPFVF